MAGDFYAVTVWREFSGHGRAVRKQTTPAAMALTTQPSE